MPYIERSISFCNQSPENEICNLTLKKISQDLLFSNYNQLLNESNISCNTNPIDSVSCNFMGNYCILNSESIDYCNRFHGTSANYICIQYQQSYTEMFRDTLIPQSYDYSNVIKIVLAIFSPIGEFIKYSPLTNEIQHCWSRNNRGNLWKKFGHNYYEECSLNTSKLSLNFFEPFLFIENQNLLIPIPVLPTNYIRNGQKINTGDEIYYQFFNRFFLFDNYSHKKNQYASEISFIFYVREDDHKQIYAPYLTVKYESVQNSNEIQNFKFSARYLLSDIFFKYLKIVSIIISIILAICYFLVSLFINARTLNLDGSNKYFVFSILKSLFDSIGSALFLVSFFLGFYILCGYKWTNHLFMCLEATSKYNFLLVFVFISLFFKLLSIIFLLINQSHGTLQVIDWDQRSSLYNNDSRSQFISRSRRDIAANEWLKLSTVRGIDTPFIIIFVLLIIRGCKMYFLQQPIPTTEKVDAGKKYPIIEIGLTSFTWLLTSFLFWIIKRFLYWNIFGNPFTNFQQLCLSLNVSVVMMMNDTRGFLINGKQYRRISASHLTNVYDHHYNLDPENKVQSKHDTALNQNNVKSPIIDVSSEHSQNKFEHSTTSNNNEIKIIINDSNNELDEQSVQNVDNSNSDHTEPQKFQVDLNSTDNKKQKISNPKNSRVKFIEQDFKKIDNVGMENDDSDSIKIPKGNNKRKKSKSEYSNDDDSKSKNSDSDIDIDIDTSDSQPGKSNHYNSSLSSDIQEEEEDLSDSKGENNQPNNLIHNKYQIEQSKTENDDINFQEEEEEITYSTSEDNKNHLFVNNKKQNERNKIKKDNIDIQEEDVGVADSKGENKLNSSTNKNKNEISNNSNLFNRSEDHISISNNKNNFDSNVFNDNKQTASKALKKFRFKPVNLLEEESQNDDYSLSYYYSDLISDSHYTEESTSEEYSNSQNVIYAKNSQKQKQNTKNRKKHIHDVLLKLDPLDKKNRGTNQVFEIFLDPEFFHYVNKSDEVINIILSNNKKKIYPESTKSIPELKEESNLTWCSILLNENPDFSYIIETMSLAQSIFKIGPVSALASFFTIQKDSSFKESMLYGIEGSILFFNLILFVSVELISNASIAGLVVFLTDTLILKLFKYQRRKYLLDRQFSPYKSLVR